MDFHEFRLRKCTSTCYALKRFYPVWVMPCYFRQEHIREVIYPYFRLMPVNKQNHTHQAHHPPPQGGRGAEPRGAKPQQAKSHPPGAHHPPPQGGRGRTPEAGGVPAPPPGGVNRGAYMAGSVLPSWIVTMAIAQGRNITP